MKIENYVAAEFVGIGHPDKLADIISDYVAYDFLEEDPNAKTAIEVMVSNFKVVVAGEVSTSEKIRKERTIGIVKSALNYCELEVDKYQIEICINQQSKEINQLVQKDNGKLGAGDQGIVVGYATNETKEFLNKEFVIAKNAINEVWILNSLNEPYLLDNKCLVIATRDVFNDFRDIEKIVVSTQIKKGMTTKLKTSKQDELRKRIAEIIHTQEYKIQVNFFEKGGSEADTGLTGRKIVADSYGSGFVGGGAFCGKDFSKVDRTGAYFARYIAKNLVATELVKKCQVTLIYEIGNEYPSGININFFDDEFKRDYTCHKLKEAVLKVFDFNLTNIVRNFKLKDFDIRDTAIHSHFGKIDYPWEKLNKVEAIKKELYK